MVVAAGERGTIVQTADGGVTWTQQDTPAVEGGMDLYALHFANSSWGWAVGYESSLSKVDGKGRLLHTRDAGVAWSWQTYQPSVALYAVTFADSMRGWAAGQQGRIFHTTDGGTTWAGIPTCCSHTLYDIAIPLLGSPLGTAQPPPLKTRNNTTWAYGAEG
eukprot:gene2887-3695_t